MDVKSLQYEDASIDIVIDKACFDAILCSENAIEGAETMLREVSRVLKPGGIYISISYGIPENRMLYFGGKDYNWIVGVHKILKPQIPEDELDEDEGRRFHYMYVMKK